MKLWKSMLLAVILAGMASLTIGWFFPAPFIDTVFPPYGRIGDTIIITGSGFSSAAIVRFGDVVAPLVASDSPLSISAQLVVKVPNLGPSAVPTQLTVTVAGAQSNVWAFTYLGGGSVTTTTLPVTTTLAPTTTTAPQSTTTSSLVGTTTTLPITNAVYGCAFLVPIAYTSTQVRILNLSDTLALATTRLEYTDQEEAFRERDMVSPLSLVVRAGRSLTIPLNGLFVTPINGSVRVFVVGPREARVFVLDAMSNFVMEATALGCMAIQ